MEEKTRKKKGFSCTTYLLIILVALLAGTGAGYTITTIDSPRRINDVKIIEKDTASIEEAKKIVEDEITVAKAAVKYWGSIQKPPGDIGTLIATSLLEPSYQKYGIQTSMGKNGPVIKVSLPEVTDRVCNAINRDLESNPDAGPGRTATADQEIYPVQCNDIDQARNNNNVVSLIIGDATDEESEQQPQPQSQPQQNTQYKDLR